MSVLKDALKVNDSKALASLKAWAKLMGVDIPSPPRKVKTPKIGFTGYYKKVLEHVIENKDITRDEVIAFCKSNGVPTNYTATVMNIIHFAKQWNGEIKGTPEA